MRTLRRLTALASLGIPLTAVASAQADPIVRYQVDQRGDFVLFGNTLGFECYAGEAGTVIKAASALAIAATALPSVATAALAFGAWRRHRECSSGLLVSELLGVWGACPPAALRITKILTPSRLYLPGS